MGLIALALASAPPHRLLSRAEALRRIRAALETALFRLPHDHGILPHFLDPATEDAHGGDAKSTIDSGWLLAGGLWAAAFLGEPDLQRLADDLYDRVDWSFWAAPEGTAEAGLLRHGRGRDGRFLPCVWDRLNGETVFLYVLAAGAAQDRALAPAAWHRLRPFYGTAAGLRFNNADLGLFVFQYGLDLLDLRRWTAPGPVDLAAEAGVATRANLRTCREAQSRFRTYRQFWGLSAGDGPGAGAVPYVYRCYSPARALDGTAHVMATLASVAHAPAEVLDNVGSACRLRTPGALGRYGPSNINLDRGWIGPDMVGIDAGAAVLALDNFLMGDRVREVFHRIPCVREGCARLGFRPAAAPALRQAG
jgi:hypothetical protein